MFWNDEKLIVEPYKGIRKQYYCGKELLMFDNDKTLVYQIVLVDFNECYIAKVYSDGEIEKVFHDTSLVPNKMGAGGQSAARFQRIRQQEIIHWFKKINDQIMNISGDIILGISSVYYSTFERCLHTYAKQKIKRQMTIEYNGLTGIYALLNTLHKEKHKNQ